MTVTSKRPTDDMMDVARQAVSLAQKKGAVEAAATASRTREVDVTWRDGRLERVSEATSRALSLQLYVEGRFSVVSTSDLRPPALEAFIGESVAMTRTLAVDEHRRLPDPELYQGRASDDLRIEDARQRAVVIDERRQFAQTL